MLVSAADEPVNRVIVVLVFLINAHTWGLIGVSADVQVLFHELTLRYVVLFHLPCVLPTLRGIERSKPLDFGIRSRFVVFYW